MLVSIMAVLSIIAAVREAYAYRKADKELIKQYRFMRRIFANARAALDRTGDPVEQREILHALGEAALAEHAEWTLIASGRWSGRACRFHVASTPTRVAAARLLQKDAL